MGVSHMDDETREWIRSRPPEVQESMKRWPPVCRVRAKADKMLHVPAPGVIGRVVSWYENGNLGVVAEGGGELRGECEPGWLELVEYDTLTPAGIEEALAPREVE